MPLRSRLSSLLESLARDPRVRRAARDVARSALDRVTAGRASSGGDRTGDRRDAHRSARRGSRNGAPESDAPAGTATSALADRPAMPPLHLDYSPVDDDLADPGEVVWAWVAFEEDISRGKDRPVLVLAREEAAVGGRDGDGEVLIALMLTSHDRGTGTHVDQRGGTWVDVGTGAWDREGRPSEVRADRLLRIPVRAVRREGARLDRARFDAVAAAASELHGWSR